MRVHVHRVMFRPLPCRVQAIISTIQFSSYLRSTFFFLLGGIRFGFSVRVRASLVLFVSEIFWDFEFVALVD